MTLPLPLQIELLDQMTATTGAAPSLDRDALTQAALDLADTHQLAITKPQVNQAVDQVLAKRTPSATPEITWDRPTTADELAQQRATAWQSFVTDSNRSDAHFWSVGLTCLLAFGGWLCWTTLTPTPSPISVASILLIPIMGLGTLCAWVNPLWKRARLAKNRSDELASYPVTEADLERWSRDPRLAKRVRELMMSPTGLLQGDLPDLQALAKSLRASGLQAQVDRFLQAS